jgi:hypothetical protein
MIWRLKQLLRLANAMALTLYRVMIGPLAFAVSHLRRRDRAVMVWQNTDRVLDIGVALFVHFDAGGVVRPYVLHYLETLRNEGLSVMFVTNSGRLQPESLARVQALCDGVMIRRNSGYDFAAMREALHRFDLPRDNTELLLLVNDSVYGPLRPLDDLIGRIDLQRADLWGATESWQNRYHLQSYCLAAGRTVLTHPAWRDFWAQVRPIPSKSAVIRRYEVGLSQAMIKAGLRCAAMWPYTPLINSIDQTLLAAGDEDGVVSPDPMQQMRHEQARRIRSAQVKRHPLNPTADLWRQLLQAGFPFIKRELLRANPTDVADVIDWRLEAARVSDIDLRVIERDLQRALRNRAP